MDPRSNTDFNALNSYLKFMEKLEKAKENQTRIIDYKYMPCGSKPSQIFNNELNTINTCHIDTFIGALYLTLAHHSLINKFISETEQNVGLRLTEVFNAIGNGNFGDGRYYWLETTGLINPFSSGFVLDLVGRNWERTGKALELPYFLHYTFDAFVGFLSVIEPTMNPDSNEIVQLQELINDLFSGKMLVGHQESIYNTRDSADPGIWSNMYKVPEEHSRNACSPLRFTYGAPYILLISLEKIARQMNLFSIPMNLFVNNQWYEFLFVSLGLDHLNDIGHITGLMNIGEDWIHYNGVRVFTLQLATSATQLHHNGIYLVAYRRVESLNTQQSIPNNSPSVLEKLQEYKIKMDSICDVTHSLLH